MSFGFLNIKSVGVKNYITFTIIGIISIIVLNTLVIYGLEIKGSFLLLLFSAATFLLFNVNLTFSLLLFVLFLPYALPVHQSVVFSIFVLLVVLFNYKDISLNELKNPLLKFLLLYLFISLPSLVNTPQLLLSIRDLLNLLGAICIFSAVLISVKEQKQMFYFFYFFIGATFLHSLHVIFLGLTTGGRAFGILHVYYIDFAGLGSLMTFILILFAKGMKKNFFIIAFIIITLGLVLTQTRNAWLSTGFAIGTLVLYLFFKSKKFFLKKYVLGTLSVVVIITAIIFSLSAGVNVTDRLDVSSQETVLTDDPGSVGENSFVSRALIWHTAFYAFLEHPFIGIGTYSFRHTSQQYYTIPKGFYKAYVETKTPHVTYLQVLTETGIIGLVVFLIFILSLIKYSIKTLKFIKEKKDILITLLIVWSFVYIVFSMIMTESWLYGQYIVWIGMLLGMLVNNRKVLETAQ